MKKRFLNLLFVYSAIGFFILWVSSSGYFNVYPINSYLTPEDGAEIVCTDTENNIIHWNVTWGGSLSDEGYRVAIGTDGGIYVTGYTWSFAKGFSDLALVKFDPNGTKIWDVTWGDSLSEQGRGVAVGSDGAIYVAGDTNEFGAVGFDVALVKFYSNGTRAWNVTWGSALDDYGKDVAVDLDGAIYVAGQTDSSGLGSDNVSLVKFYPNGTKVWNVTWGGVDFDIGWGVAVGGDGCIYVTGQTWSFGAGGYDVVLLKFYPNGTKVWEVTWGTPANEEGHGVAVGTDGNIYVAGMAFTSETASRDSLLVKFYPNGTAAWNNTWGGAAVDESWSVAIGDDGALYTAGFAHSFGAGGADVTLAKFYPNGTKMWNITWGGASDDQGYGMAVGSDGILYTAGFTSSYGAGSKDLALIKFGMLESPVLNPILPNPDTDGLIKLNWSTVVGADRYYLYRDSSSITSVEGLTPIAMVTNCNYTDSLTTNGNYYYVVVAGTGTTNSSISNCENITVAIPPTSPVLNSISPNPDSDGVITLIWSTVVGADRYYLYRDSSSITSVEGLIPIAMVTNCNFTDSLATNGTYYYVVVAGDGFANSSNSNCESVVVAIPSPPEEEPGGIPSFEFLYLILGLFALAEFTYWRNCKRNTSKFPFF